MTYDSTDRNRQPICADRSAPPPEAESSGLSVLSDATSRRAEREATGRPSVQLLRAIDAARALAISPRKLWGLTRSGEIKCVRIGRSVRYTPEDLTAFIASKRNA